MTPTDQELRDTRAMVINEKAIEAIVDLSQAVTELTKAVRKLDNTRQPEPVTYGEHLITQCADGTILMKYP